jgi:translation initiation factor IF-2
MSKVRVYEVARELGLQNRDLVQRLSSMGIQVSNHMSALDPAEVDRIKRSFDRDKSEKTVEERIRPTVVRRRTVQPRKRAAAADQDAAPATAAEGRSPTRETAATAASPASRQPTRPTPPQPPRPAPEARTGDARPPATSKPAAAEAGSAAPTSEAPARPAALPSAKGQEADRAAASPTPPAAGSGSAAADGTAPSTDRAATPPTPADAERPAAAAAPTPAAAPEAPGGGAPERTAPAAAPPRPAPPSRDARPSGTSKNTATPPPPETQPPPRQRRPSGPPPASERLGHANLPLGVVSRGKSQAPGATPLSAEARAKIVSQHAQRQSTPRRRSIVDRAGLGPTGRQQTRPGKRKMAPGKKARQTEITVPSAQKRVIRIEDQITLQQLAHQMSLKATDVLMKLMQLGMSGVHINSSLDADTAKILASDFGYEVENVAKSEDELVGDARGEFRDLEEDREPRAPIITVMGHVDHGKTSLLDKIRKANVVSGEAGGITQHIGAYRVDTKKGPIVFLDTPGHEAFTSMRARGAQATDVVILVVAADDGVMPQTKEAVNHAKAAEVPIVVAVNKIDREGATPERVMNELAAEGLQPEAWGGDTMFVPTSAITGQGLDDLLEGVALQAELLELHANPKIPAEGVVLEAYLDKGRGPVANVLIRNGSLKTGDFVVAGPAWGRVRALTDDRGKKLKVAKPSTPVEVLGLSEMPRAGDILYQVQDQKKAQELAGTKTTGPKGSQKTAAAGLDQLYARLQAGDVAELKLVVKADVQGSLEAVEKALADLSTEKVRVNIIHTGVGGITENDVMLASASNAIIAGFNVRPAGQAAATAKKEDVDLRNYTVIYDAVDDVKKAMVGLLAPTLEERELGKAEVRATFGIPKIGTIAGCYVLEGKIRRNAKARLVRDSVQVWQGDVGSLRRFKDDVREVAAGFECGVGLKNYNDLKEGDIIEFFEIEEVAATL